MSEILVFVGETDDGPTTLGLELLTKARQLGTVSVFYVGRGGETAWGTLGAHGATRVFHLDPESALSPAPAAVALAGVVETLQPDLILFGQAYDDRDTAGRLAARLGRSVLSNAVDVTTGDTTTTTHEIFGGAKIVTATLDGPKPHLVMVRPKSFPVENVGGGLPQVSKLDVPEVGGAGARVGESHVAEKEGPQLEEAAIIVAGGRGLGAAEKYQMIERLAKPLKAATGATRAIVDAGWVPYSKQVGQTGKTVKPDVYIACGVSGAMQHLVGMKDSKTIIAINKDPDAPIFAVADLGIVGDVNSVLPKLIEALESRG